jgi:hypothetical protein
MGLHGTLAIAAVVTTAIVLAVGVLTGTGRAGSRRAVDRAVLAQLAVTFLAVASGTAVPFTGGSAPSDPLHVVYGGVSLLGVPTARYAARHRDTQALSRWTAVGAAIGLAAMLRSFMTGG